MSARERTTEEQKGESHPYDPRAIRRATKEPPSNTAGDEGTPERPRLPYGERGEKVNHTLESLQLSRKDQVSISRLRSCHQRSLNYWLHKTGRALDTVCGSVYQIISVCCTDYVFEMNYSSVIRKLSVVEIIVIGLVL